MRRVLYTSLIIGLFVASPAATFATMSTTTLETVATSTATTTVSAATTTPSLPFTYAGKKLVALTFDDGPYGTSTAQVLQILSNEKVPATFFVVGKNVALYPAEARAEVRNGNQIGNHTNTHPHLSALTLTQSLRELSLADRQIASTTGIHTHLFRPPFDDLPKKTGKAIIKKGYSVVLWNVDPVDWDAASTTSSDIVARVLAQEKPRMIIVMHDGRDTQVNYPRDNMIQALPVLIEDLEAQGYTFVTVSQLMRHGGMSPW